jgi:2-oxo-4-hydroxy-4-carboxy-5-ureidoimidazoline decarboxylase
MRSSQKKFASTKEWAEQEQEAVTHTTNEVLDQLADHNKQYEEKFGFIFIVCATGRSAEEMLNDLKTRLNNNKEQELEIAAAEQLKITRLRLEKLFGIDESSKTENI